MGQQYCCNIKCIIETRTFTLYLVVPCVELQCPLKHGQPRPILRLLQSPVTKEVITSSLTSKVFMLLLYIFMMIEKVLPFNVDDADALDCLNIAKAHVQLLWGHIVIHIYYCHLQDVAIKGSQPVSLGDHNTILSDVIQFMSACRGLERVVNWWVNSLQKKTKWIKSTNPLIRVGLSEFIHFK